MHCKHLENKRKWNCSSLWCQQNVNALTATRVCHVPQVQLFWNRCWAVGRLGQRPGRAVDGEMARGASARSSGGVPQCVCGVPVSPSAVVTRQSGPRLCGTGLSCACGRWHSGHMKPPRPPRTRPRHTPQRVLQPACPPLAPGTPRYLWNFCWNANACAGSLNFAMAFRCWGSICKL